MSLLYGNQDVDTILCKAELDDYAAAHPGRFHLHHTVAKAPPPEARTNGPSSIGFADGYFLVVKGPDPYATRPL